MQSSTVNEFDKATDFKTLPEKASNSKKGNPKKIDRSTPFRKALERRG